MLLFGKKEEESNVNIYTYICVSVYMKILLKREHVVCIQSLFHAPTENEEVSNYELLKEISDERWMWKDSGRFKREREKMSA